MRRIRAALFMARSIAQVDRRGPRRGRAFGRAALATGLSPNTSQPAVLFCPLWSLPSLPSSLLYTLDKSAVLDDLGVHLAAAPQDTLPWCAPNSRPGVSGVLQVWLCTGGLQGLHRAYGTPGVHEGTSGFHPIPTPTDLSPPSPCPGPSKGRRRELLPCASRPAMSRMENSTSGPYPASRL